MNRFFGTPQDLDWGFIIISTDSNHINLENTVKSIRANYDNAPITCVYCKEIKDLKCQNITLVSSKPNYAAMINSGMESTNNDWNIIFIAGTHVRKSIAKKYSMFIESENDVLFPNDLKRSNFIDGTINGLCLHKEFFKRVGNFNESSEKLEHSKAEWGFNAISYGVKFKAICNTKSI